jgi:HD-GYP domain-containing protein (c-di-GMP phosphodiesterase class II)
MSEYASISGDALLEGAEVEFDLFLRADAGASSNYVLYCRSGEDLSHERKEELLNKHVDRLCISTEDIGKYIEYQEKNLKKILSDENRSTKEKSGIVYQVATKVVADLLENPKSGKNMERISEWVTHTVSHIVQDDNSFSSLLGVVSHDYQIYTHSVNMSVLGLLFGKHLSFKQDELARIGSGMLLHDMGKLTIPLNVVNKPGHLTGEEFKAMKKHPKAGLEILEHRSNVNVLSLKIVIQHHENYDGSGYPYGIKGDEIHLFGRIARIIDAYDAMTSKRSYAEAMRPFAVLAEMKNKMPGCFDEELLREFVYFLGPKDQRKKRRSGDKLYSFPSVK